MYVIFFISKLYEDDNYAGTVSLIYDIGVLNQIVSPLYQDIENNNSNVNLFIYAPRYDQVTGKREPVTYDKPVFKESENFETLPEADF